MRSQTQYHQANAQVCATLAGALFVAAAMFMALATWPANTDPASGFNITVWLWAAGGTFTLIALEQLLQAYRSQ